MALGKDYATQECSIARALEVVGERWTLLVLRDVFLGLHRFDELIASLGVTRTVLTHRLRKLVDEGVLERRRYQERPERFSYHPTEKGRALLPVLMGLMRWGDAYYAGAAGPPRLLLHRGCGGALTDTQTCGRCAAAVGFDEVDAPLGPSFVASARARTDARAARD
jgi:DNA-binding HxlR family transcriptional regulator